MNENSGRLILITGGKYQGKLETAFSLTGYSVDDVNDYSDLTGKKENPGAAKIWYNTEEYVRELAEKGLESYEIEDDVIAWYEVCRPELVIISETGGGVIPLRKEDNVFREATGHLAGYFAKEADEVYRVVCAVPVRIK